MFVYVLRGAMAFTTCSDGLHNVERCPSQRGAFSFGLLTYILLELAHYVKRHCTGAIGQVQGQGAVLRYLPEERTAGAVLSCLDVKGVLLQMTSSRGIGGILHLRDFHGANPDVLAQEVGDERVVNIKGLGGEGHMAGVPYVEVLQPYGHVLFHRSLEVFLNDRHGGGKPARELLGVCLPGFRARICLGHVHIVLSAGHKNHAEAQCPKQVEYGTAFIHYYIYTLAGATAPDYSIAKIHLIFFPHKAEALPVRNFITNEDRRLSNCPHTSHNIFLFGTTPHLFQ